MRGGGAVKRREALGGVAVVLACAVGVPAQAHADTAMTVSPGMQIRQGGTVCMVGQVDPRLRIALTTGQCGGAVGPVTDADGNSIGTVVQSRRQTGEGVAADNGISPVEYEVIALGREVTVSDQLPTGRHLHSVPGVTAQPGLPVCQFRSSAGE